MTVKCVNSYSNIRRLKTTVFPDIGNMIYHENLSARVKLEIHVLVYPCFPIKQK